MTQVATFWLEDRLYGADILHVREINRSGGVTPVPHAPDFVRGLMNLRGQIVTVIDLRTRLGMPARETGEESNVVILKRDEELRALEARGEAARPLGCSDTVGLIVDGIGDVVEATAAISEATPANVGEVDSRYVAGVVKCEGELVVLLDLGAIVRVEH